MDKLKQLFDELTPARRKKLYKIAAMIATILVAKGVVAADDIMGWIEVLGYALGVIAPTVAHARVNIADD